MNIIEAIKSGKRFKRDGHDKYYSGIHSPASEHVSLVYDGIPVTLSEDLFLADDWEIEEERIEITKTQFINAWSKCLGELDIRYNPHGKLVDGELLLSFEVSKKLTKELGFEE